MRDNVIVYAFKISLELIISLKNVIKNIITISYRIGFTIVLSGVFLRFLVAFEMYFVDISSTVFNTV